MSQTTLHITAGLSMLAISFLFASMLFLLDHGPLTIIVGGTLAGIAVYIAFFVFGMNAMRQELIEQEEQDT